jgi:hypothetical protein
MKITKIIVFSVLMFWFAHFSNALEISLSLNAGKLFFNNAKMKDVYQSGMIYNACFGLKIQKSVWLLVGYDFGYEQSGQIGNYNENTTFAIKRLEAALMIPISITKAIHLFIKAGGCQFDYTQTIDSSYAPVMEIAEKNTPIYWVVGWNLR